MSFVPASPSLGGAAIAAALFIGAACVTALSILALRPLLLRYALARPNARSLHKAPTPQGGGIAVLLGAGLAALAGGVLLPAAVLPAAVLPGMAAAPGGLWLPLGLVLAASIAMACVGLIDDIRPLPPLPRLGLQLLCVAAVVAALPQGSRVLPVLPLWGERLLLVVGGAWFVNLVNFMDGMDWMSVTEILPMTGVLALLSGFGWLSVPAGLVALGLSGGLAGFAPFNRPVARLFLGDVGSLPIGLMVAFCLFDLAQHGAPASLSGLAAAILLPLYYIADSGTTLLWRLKRGDRVWEAHRQHFYQVAVARGLSVSTVLAWVLATNGLLAALAAASLWADDLRISWLALALGAAAVAGLLHRLRTGRTRPLISKDVSCP